MGYAYDFNSIMHYGPRFYSKNNRPTIKVKRLFRRIGATIGQRRGLSWIDIAQVHAMYNCNVIPSPESGKTSSLTRYSLLPRAISFLGGSI